MCHLTYVQEQWLNQFGKEIILFGMFEEEACWEEGQRLRLVDASDATRGQDGRLVQVNFNFPITGPNDTVTRPDSKRPSQSVSASSALHLQVSNGLSVHTRHDTGPYRREQMVQLVSIISKCIEQQCYMEMSDQ